MKKRDDKLQLPPARQTLILIVPSTIFLVVIIMELLLRGSQQFSLLAKAFLHGQLNFLAPIGGAGQDPIIWHGKIYWGEGPFPAILLMPFVAIFSIFHLFFYQAFLDWALILGVAFFVFKLARSLGYAKADSLILMFGFVLGSTFIGVAAVSSSWLFAQVLTTFLLFWALYEYFTRKRWWLIGVICGLVLLTRATAIPLIIFFALEVWQNTPDKQKLKRLVQLCMPVVVAGALIGLYNYLRFQSPFNGGYAYQVLHASSAEARSLGEFSLVHIPTNFYSAVLSAPITVARTTTSWTLKFPYIKNNLYGMSIFVTSPYLLSLFFHKWSSFDSRARHLLAASLIGALFVFSYFGIGLQQFGYRYSLDFLPGLFVLFMIMYRKNHQRLSGGMKTVLIVSGALNFYLLLTFISQTK